MNLPDDSIVFVVNAYSDIMGIPIEGLKLEYHSDSGWNTRRSRTEEEKKAWLVGRYLWVFPNKEWMANQKKE